MIKKSAAFTEIEQEYTKNVMSNMNSIKIANAKNSTAKDISEDDFVKIVSNLAKCASALEDAKSPLVKEADAILQFIEKNFI